MRCAACGFVSPEGFKFCGSCGGPLAAAPVAPVLPETPVAMAAPVFAPPLTDGFRVRPVADERRTVTILFADMSGFTALSETLDPEDVQEIMNQVFGRLAAVVKDFGGTIDKYIGDAIMALFGAPIALGDDAERAVRAGLGMQKALAGYSDELEKKRGTRLNLRVGVNTGKVIWGRSNDGSFTVMGDAVNVASRLEKHCPLGGVLIGESTHRHVKSRFTLETREPLQVKGKVEAQRTYLVRGESGGGAGGERGTGTGPRSPLVGRDEEMDAVGAALARIREGGAGAVLTFEAPPGGGKTRLLREIRDEADGREVRALSARAPAFGQGAPFAPWADLLHRAAGTGALPPEAARAKITAWLAQTAPGAGVDARWLHELASIADISDPELVRRRANPARFRAMLGEAVAGFLAGAAATRAIVLLAEDLHWWPLPSFELLREAAAVTRTAPLLVIAARRPDEPGSAAWPPDPATDRTFTLAPLDTAALRSLAHAMLGQEVPPGLVVRLEALSGGNPLFAEEIIQALEEAGALKLDPTGGTGWIWDEAKAQAVNLPTSVEGITQARIDALAPRERRALTAAAVGGRTFWEGMVDAVRGESSREPLRLLTARDLVHPRKSRLAGENELAFKHATVQAVAYEVALKRERTSDHRKVAEWLEAKAGAQGGEFATSIAEHYLRAEEKTRALPWLLLAAEEAVRVYARLDEARVVEDAVATAEAVGDDAMIGRALRLRGRLRRIAGHPGAEVDLRRAAGIADRGGDKLGRAEAGVDLAGVLHQRGALADAETCARGTLEAALAVGSARHETQALNMLGIVTNLRGDFTAARARYDEALKSARRTGDGSLEGFVLVSMGYLHFRHGDHREAIDAFHRALGMDVSRETAAFLRSNLGAAYLAIGDLDAAEAALREAVDAAQRIGLKVIVAEAGLRMGSVTAARGDIAGGLAEIDAGCALARQIGATEPLTEGLLRKGELLAVSDPRAARLALGEAEALAQKDGLEGLLAKIRRARESLSAPSSTS